MKQYTPLILALGFSVALLAGAQSVSAAQTVAQHVAAIQAKGDTDITDRASSLTKLMTSVASTSKLTTAQKAQLTTEMQGEVTSLSALKTSLDKETTVATAKADFQNIFAQHYIYAFYVPRVNRIIAADHVADAATTLTLLVPKLTAYIATAKSQGKDVAALQTNLTDLQAKLTAATTQSEAVIATLTPLAATGYPANKTSVTGSSATLKTARADIESAKTDAHTIVTDLKKLLTSVQ